MASDFGQTQNPTSNFPEQYQNPNHLKRGRDQFESEQMRILALPPRLRFTRIKDVGTKLKQVDQRNKRIIEIAEPLPANGLTARSVYWFVTTEEVQLSIQDTKLFLWKEAIIVNQGGTTYYLNQVNFAKNKKGMIGFTFPDGAIVVVVCNSTSSQYPASKKVKLSPSASGSAMEIDDESQSAVQPITGTPQYYGQSNNTNQFYQPVAPNYDTPPSSSYSQSPVIDYGMFPQHIRSPPQDLSNSDTLPSGTALIVNILLLVPDKPELVQMVERVLLYLEFAKEASCTNQTIFSQKNLSNTTRHVLLFPYSKPGSLYVIEDYMPQTSEVILLLENEVEQQGDFLVVSQITNIPNANNWPFTCKTNSFGTVEVDFRSMNQLAKLIFAIGKLHDVVLGGASWKKSLGSDHLAECFSSFFLEWTLAVTKRHFVQNIYICFRFKPENVKAFTFYAASILDSLGIEFDLDDFDVFHGSVLVYLRCPSYVTWYILQRKDHIFNTLRKEGLTEIYEAFVSDIEASMSRPENKEFMHELTHLQEQMICDRIADEPTPNRVIDPKISLALDAIRHMSNTIVNAAAPEAVVTNELDRVIRNVVNMSISEAEMESYLPPTVEKLPSDKRKVLEEKHAELKKFDNKWTKTIQECYDSDKLRQQLFNFKTDKNPKIAVRVFLSSASAGLATNVAKLMRQFRGKSIVDGVHSGLQIGNTVIEWNQSGIVHIGELKYGNAVAVLFNVKDEKFMDFTEEKAQKMINFIQKWNTECQYSTNEFNSHRFVRDFLQYTMNVSLLESFKGPLGSYMEHVMKTGDVTPRLISKTLGTMVFKSHKDLEDKDRDIRDKLNEDELKLLKIFHRGFQLEEAANGQDVSSCCYGLPTNGLEILNDSGKPMQ